MNLSRFAVIASFLLSSISLCWSLLTSKPMQAQAQSDAFGTYAAMAFGMLVCSWPWFAAFFAASKPSGHPCALIYAIGSAAISLAFSAVIPSSPAEGIGWNLILCVVLLWGLYLFSSRLRAEPEA